MLFSRKTSVFIRGAGAAAAPLFFSLSLLLFLFLFPLPAARAAGPGAAAAPAGETPESLAEKIEQAKIELGRLNAKLPGGAAPVVEQEEFRINYELLQNVYEEHLDLLTTEEEWKRKEAEWGRKLGEWNGFSRPPPYSVLFLDALRIAFQDAAAKGDRAKEIRASLESLAPGFESEARAARAHLRLAAERMEGEQDPAARAALEWERDLENSRIRKTEALAALNRARAKRLDAEHSCAMMEKALLERQIRAAAEKTEFPRRDLDRVLERIGGERRKYERMLEKWAARRDAIRAGLDTARERLRQRLLKESARDAAADAADGGDAAAAARAGIQALQAAVDRREVEQEANGRALSSIRRILELLVGEQGIWQARFELFHAGNDALQIKRGFQGLEEIGRSSAMVADYFTQERDLAERALMEQNARIDRLGPAADDSDRQILQACRDRFLLASKGISSAAALARLGRLWNASISEKQARMPAGEKIQGGWRVFASWIRAFWNFELFTASDSVTVDGKVITSERSITVGKTTLMLLLLALGYVCSVWLGRAVSRASGRVFNIEPPQITIVRRTVRGVSMLAFVIFSLTLVKIPLTIFAFLGGALAIGLGFGTQNLLKNFISGIIILFERPFQVGHVLDVDGKCGRVLSIGIRSSVLKLFDGQEILIPNSVLLENNLVNWTYSSRRMRFEIEVGVAYGSDTQKVSGLLLDAAARHGLVLKDPPPEAIFRDFGDSALVFALRYWIDVSRHDPPVIASDLRHIISASFETAGISIPFPQRDLHFDPAPPPPAPPAGAAARRGGRTG